MNFFRRQKMKTEEVKFQKIKYTFSSLFPSKKIEERAMQVIQEEFAKDEKARKL